MKITFDTNNTNQNVDRVMTTTYRDTRTQKTDKAEQTGGYALDISGTVTDNAAYKGQGKTTEDIMQAAEQDYMAVMSNSMSTEDFNRMVKDGYQVEDMDVEEVVTIVDTIKAELVKGGVYVAGYTDQIDEETLAEITGSEVFARELCKQFAEHDVPVTEENVQEARKAYDRAAALYEPSEGAKKYMVENHMEPTIDNLYLAEHSSTVNGDRQGRGYYSDGSGYYAKKADEYNWQQLQPQMEKILEEAGLEVNEETLEDAKWLIEKGIPLTPEAVSDLHKLDGLTFPQDREQILSAIASAIADGKNAGKADLADSRSDFEKAAEYVERFAQITDEAVDKAVAEDKALTLANLENAQKQIENKQDPAEGNTAKHDIYREKDNVTENFAQRSNTADIPENITARRQLEEVRLMMTIEVNRKLLESGYSIDTTELERLVDTLKQIETRQNQILFGEADIDRVSEKAALYTETRNKVAEIPFLPIDMVGRFKVTDEDFTLNQVHVQGSALRNHYDEARDKYENWTASPREDLGDSIQKAFRNIDDILQDMELEDSEENRRAVRILGYNQMELSEENIQAVKASDMELRRVIDKMTPAAVLQTIREGKNPLEMTIPELNDYLDSMQYGQELETEKYSRFLYKLDKNNEIDENEREAYIGIYRMLRQIEKTDDAAVGTLLNAGMEFSFKNLLGAIRSHKKQGMDYAVDDSFSGVEGIMKNASITDQIESGFQKYYRDIAGETADQMAKQDAATEKEYQAERMQECRQACEIGEAALNELLNNNQPVTANNLAAAHLLLNRRGYLYQKLEKFTKAADKEKVKDAVSHLHEAMTDKDSMQEAYGEMEQVFEEILEEAKDAPDIKYIDLRAIRSCQKQLALAGNLAQEENYHIPVEINGETTAIHLKVLHGKADGGKVKATLSTESYGKVAAEFSIRNKKVSGYIACSTPEGTEQLQSREESLRAELKRQVESLVQDELELGSIGVLHSAELDLNSFTAEEVQEGPSVQTADLYQIAKAFITVITE